MVKAIKQEIVLAEKDKKLRDEIYKELKTFRKQASKALNRCMTLLYAETQERDILKDREIELPNSKDVYGKTAQGVLYDFAKEEMPAASAWVTSNTAQFAFQQFGKDKKKGLLYGECSLSNFRNTAPIFVGAGGVKIKETDKGYGVELALFNNEKRKALGIKRVNFDFVRPNANAKSTLKKLISGEYGLGACSISYNERRHKWMFSISFKFDAKECTGKNVMGVDVGIHNALAFAVYNPDKKRYEWVSFKEAIISGGVIEEFRDQMNKRRRAAGINTKLSKGGRGYKRKNKKLLSLSEKERNFRDTYNHKLSSYIVRMAEKHDCGLIQLENLENFNPKDVFLKNWAYYDLQQKITYKAQEKGIEVVKVEPRYTTRRCSECGAINMEVDNTSIHEWVCPACGTKHNRDYNAAKNIALPNIEKIIKEQLA